VPYSKVRDAIRDKLEASRRRTCQQAWLKQLKAGASN